MFPVKQSEGLETALFLCLLYKVHKKILFLYAYFGYLSIEMVDKRCYNSKCQGAKVPNEK